ncbi:DUF7283 family protein [Halapricum hydrolyticum]|uniref:Uncharacterized protein n=1 Tax=Halapricum hydrolyticum TaxID=2979991 RepID=A0AAE3IE63_9EURY|nr:hypothetical protein [Halapricum hydrolyticum]MCU4717770.1 hypothetical protein [Halapricum hydrolyticum]MCU4726934.1 hypothetical protein [Halapricum hydrolyticum]
MDLEAPADAWYVWVGVALVSVAAMGIALGFPSGPPPDANAAANAIDRAAGSAHEGSATYDHDARFYWIDGERIAMQNEHGVTKATLAYGPVVPIGDDLELERVLHGERLTDVYPSNATRSPQRQFDEDVAAALASVDSVDPEWRAAGETLSVRVVDYEVGGGERRAVLLTM